MTAGAAIYSATKSPGGSKPPPAPTINMPKPAPAAPTPQAAPPSGEQRGQLSELDQAADAEAAARVSAERRKRGRRASILTSSQGATQSPTSVRKPFLGA